MSSLKKHTKTTVLETKNLVSNDYYYYSKAPICANNPYVKYYFSQNKTINHDPVSQDDTAKGIKNHKD